MCLNFPKNHTYRFIVLLCISLSKAPSGINPLEHEELPMSVQQVQQNVRPTLAAVPQMSTERHHGSFSQVNALPLSFSIKPNDTVSLYRARIDNRDVILRVLKGKKGGPTAHCMSADNWFTHTKVLYFILYKLPQSQGHSLVGLLSDFQS